MAEQRWAENQQLLVEKQQIATAISRADTYMSVTRISILLTAIMVWRMFPLASLAEAWVVGQLFAISYGAQWLSHNSSLTDEPDFLEAVGKVKKTMVALATLLLAQVAAYFLLNGLPNWYSILELFGLH